MTIGGCFVGGYWWLLIATLNLEDQNNTLIKSGINYGIL
jgi:hypothetical protein